MARKRGRDLLLYRQTTGTRAAWPVSGSAPNLTKVPRVRDVGLPFERSEHDASDRDSDFEQIMTGLIKAPLEFQLIYNPSDTHQAALETAFHAGTTVAVAVCDGNPATAGTKVFWADWEILRFAHGAPVEGGWMVDVQMKPTALSDVPPAKATVGA